MANGKRRMAIGALVSRTTVRYQPLKRSSPERTFAGLNGIAFGGGPTPISGDLARRSSLRPPEISLDRRRANQIMPNPIGQSD